MTTCQIEVIESPIQNDIVSTLNEAITILNETILSNSLLPVERKMIDGQLIFYSFIKNEFVKLKEDNINKDRIIKELCDRLNH